MVRKNMAILLFVCMTVFLIPSMAMAETTLGDTVGVSNPDTFYLDQNDKAISPEESKYFDIEFRVIQNPSQEKDDGNSGFLPIQFQLLLSNKTEYPLSDLKFNAHFEPLMQVVLVNSQWYNEGVLLDKKQDGTLYNQIDYAWEALLDRNVMDLKKDEINESSFYNIWLEITWHGGSEIIKLSKETAKWTGIDPNPPIQSIKNTDAAPNTNSSDVAQAIISFGGTREWSTFRGTQWTMGWDAVRTFESLRGISFDIETVQDELGDHLQAKSSNTTTVCGQPATIYYSLFNNQLFQGGYYFHFDSKDWALCESTMAALEAELTKVYGEPRVTEPLPEGWQMTLEPNIASYGQQWGTASLFFSSFVNLDVTLNQGDNPSATELVLRVDFTGRMCEW